MTKLRDPGSVEDGLLQAIALLGVERAAESIGKTERLVRAYSDPDDIHHIPLHLAIRLDAACVAEGHSAPVAAAYGVELGRQVAALGGVKHQADNPVNRVASLLAEAGDVAREVIAAARDGTYDAVELARIAREVRDVVEVVEALMRDLCNTEGA